MNVEEPLSATGSYVATAEIAEREARFLHRRALSAPRAWRRFTLVRVGVATGIVVLGGVLLTVDRLDPVRVVGSTVLFLVVFGLLCAFDVWSVRRRSLRAWRAVTLAGVPVGTLVEAVYTPTRAMFVLPSHSLVLDLTTIVGAVREEGMLVLEQEGAEGRVWMVPDELLGDHGLEVVRDGLGARYREVW
ncbi:hypothetical protein [Oryzobacter telluris]|uniref:hypothetical protein n=1 Tax=Oryzobacter telluris TaxID=3149179 RepID=UPI00370DE1EB